jgi:hypothetical protein
MNSDKAEDCRAMIDYLLGLVHEGKLKYEYVTPAIQLLQLILLACSLIWRALPAGGIKIETIDILEH